MNFYNDNYFDEFFETMEGYMDEGYGQGFDDSVGEREIPMSPMPSNIPQQAGVYPPAVPPKTVPQKSLSSQSAGRRNLCNCFNRYTYIWLRNGRAFWIWLVAIYNTYIICYRWNGNRWVSAQIDKRRIDFFTC